MYDWIYRLIYTPTSVSKHSKDHLKHEISWTQVLIAFSLSNIIRMNLREYVACQTTVALDSSLLNQTVMK